MVGFYLLFNFVCPVKDFFPNVIQIFSFICLTVPADKTLSLPPEILREAAYRFREWLLLSRHYIFCQLLSLKAFRLSSVVIFLSSPAHQAFCVFNNLLYFNFLQ